MVRLIEIENWNWTKNQFFTKIKIKIKNQTEFSILNWFNRLTELCTPLVYIGCFSMLKRKNTNTSHIQCTFFMLFDYGYCSIKWRATRPSSVKSIRSNDVSVIRRLKWWKNIIFLCLSHVWVIGMSDICFACLDLIVRIWICPLLFVFCDLCFGICVVSYFWRKDLYVEVDFWVYYSIGVLSVWIWIYLLRFMFCDLFMWLVLSLIFGERSDVLRSISRFFSLFCMLSFWIWFCVLLRFVFCNLCSRIYVVSFSGKQLNDFFMMISL